jgi:hypothetical protein
VVCFTDGLVERRDEPIDDGLDRLAEVVATLPTECEPDAACDAICDELLEGADQADDVCLVVVRATA